MSDTQTLARPYAVAAYKRAKETESTSKWSQTLDFLAAVMDDPQVARAAANPKASKEQFTQALLNLCQGKLDKEAENFVRLLIANRRLGLVKSICEQFEQYRAEEEGYIAVNVTTAYPIEQDENERLTALLRKVLGKEPRLNVQIDRSLIGGVLIKAGDRVIDASVQGQIQRLAKRLYN
ncbi:MAG: F0F1 ATP synthase subunit delta [Methylococcaceae bacterium]|nr:F0F1 ATP synthase subunit delta [Methylococcaceae bacterium]